MGRSSFDLALVAALAAAALVTAVAGAAASPLRAALTLPLVLALPGYSLAAALFPTRALGPLERALYTLGLSLAATVLAGGLLHLTPWGLRAESWAILLGGLTIGATVVAASRRARQMPGPGRAPAWPRVAQVAILGLAGVILVGALAVARAGALEQPSAPFTQLWALPEEGAGQGDVRLGVRNMEQVERRYRLQILADERAVGEWPAILLAPGQTWEVSVALPPASAGATVEARLYSADSPGRVYRRVVLRGDQP